LAQQIARPLEGLADAAKSIAGGNLKVHAPAKSKIKELQGLGQTFNSMTESLRQSDEAKKAFIADVTHELRTPLTVIKGTIETLEDGALDDHEGRGPLLESMQRETDRLIRLVNELLVLTRADAGALQLEIRPLDLTEVVNQRCELFSDLATRQGVKLKFGDRELAPNNPMASRRIPKKYALADTDRLSQVLDNLLGNAIRHSPQRSTITVRITESNDEVECSISDEGAGIPPEHLPFIFERFYRVDKSRNRKDGGTGLGLAIARALIHAQGGHISVQSVEGKGTTIIFRLPTGHNLTQS
jgi:two-component system sensor histidine kinase VicK